jgi:hypothetical protein
MELRVQFLVTSSEIHGIGTGVFLTFFSSPLLIIIPGFLPVQPPRPLRCAVALTTQQIVIFFLSCEFHLLLGAWLFTE